MALDVQNTKKMIEEGRAVLGIEFGSTRIKAVLINEQNEPVASGSHDWENRLDNDIWTYTQEDIWTGLRESYQTMAYDVEERYGGSDQTAESSGIQWNDAWVHGI